MPRDGATNVRAIHDRPYSRGISTAAERRLSPGCVVRSQALSVGLALVVIGALVRPLIFSHSTFNTDWVEQLWFMSQQALAIRANHAPSLFLNYRGGVLYPHYAFYGGTLYALSGALTLLLGNAPVAGYVLTYLLGFAASYGGWYWMGRMAGLGRLWAQIPGLLFVSSAYYLTLVYARGDWPEFMGVSMISLSIAAGLSVLRSDRLRLWPAVALVGSSTVFFGSHSLTLVWGGTLIVVVAIATVVAVPQARREVTRAGAIRVAGLVIPALLINAWFLCPAIAYEASTEIANAYKLWRTVLRGSRHLVSMHHLFSLSRSNAIGSGPNFALTLPVLTIGWVLVSLATLTVRGLAAAWTRMLLICVGVATLMLVMMTNAGLILVLPRAYSTLQYSYRLESYILLALSGAALAVLVLSERGGRGLRLWSWMIVPIAIFSVVGAIGQVGGYSTAGDSQTALAELNRPSQSTRKFLDYVDVRQTTVVEDPYGEPPTVYFNTTAGQDNRFTAVTHLTLGQVVDTNLEGPPTLVHVTGARIIGSDIGGYEVMAVGSVRAPEWRARGRPVRETITVGPRSSFPVVLGRYLSLVGLIMLSAELSPLMVRRLRGVRRWMTSG
jgi:hypothetical protein